MRAAALLIGCGRFNSRAIQPLRFASRDAIRIEACLKRFCGVLETYLLSDDAAEDAFQPTQANILGRVRDLLEAASSERLDRIYIFLSGHGVVSKVDHKLYFICRETDPRLLHRTALDLGGLIEEIRVEGPAQIIVLLDTCRAVFTSDTKAIAVNDYTPFRPNGQFAAVVYSCAPGDASYESEAAQAGVFTEAFIREMDESGYCTTLGELRDKLPNTMAEVSRGAGKPLQRPFFSVEDSTGAEIVLVDKPTLLKRRRASLLTGEVRHSRTGRQRPSNLVNSAAAIDFGTTKTLTAFPLIGGGMYLVRSPSGAALLETSVILLEDLGYVIGSSKTESANSLRLRDIKRDTGREKAFRHRGLAVSVTEAMAMVLSSVRRNIEDEVGGPPPSIIASYPVNFDTRQYAQLRRAFVLAGFTIERMISEAAAAAIALQTRLPDQALRALVLDLGGGTFDVAVAELGDGVIEIREVDGDKELGGRDFDNVIFEMLNEAIETQNEAFPAESSLPRVDQFDSKIEQARFELNAGRDAVVLVGEREGPDGTNVDSTAILRVEDFEDRCAPLLERMRAAIIRVLAMEPLASTDESIRPVIMLAGQGTRLTFVRRTIEQLFPNIEVFDSLQENAVVTGLAKYAAVLAGAEKSVLLLDVYHRLPGFFRMGFEEMEISGELHDIHVIGPPGSNREFIPFFPRQITIPTRSRNYVSFADNADALLVVERDVAGTGEYELGTVRIKSSAKSKHWRLNVDIDPDSSMLLELTPITLTPAGISAFEMRPWRQLGQWLSITSGETSVCADGTVEFSPARSLQKWLETH